MVNSPFVLPSATARDIALSRIPDDPGSQLHESLYPEDVYQYQTQKYWADLPRKEQVNWIIEQSNGEAAREFGKVWQTFRQDPLKSFGQYLHNYAVTGLGFSTEGYTLFSVGNILSPFETVWPTCYKQYKVYNKVWVQSINYLGIVGILLGQIGVGIIGTVHPICGVNFFDSVHR